MTKPNWIIDAPRDAQSVTPDWRRVTATAIDGVWTKETAWVPCANGGVVELARTEWLGEHKSIDQVFLRSLDSGQVSGWHAHAITTDRLFCIHGRLKVVLYDARTDSGTRGAVSEYILSRERPTLVVVPPGVFHGLCALGPDPALVVNMVDHAYAYADPDHWRAPLDSPEIPYKLG